MHYNHHLYHLHYIDGSDFNDHRSIGDFDYKDLDEAIKEDAENTITSWWIIKDWYDSTVDEYRNIVNNSKDWLAKYQAKLISDTWISWIKIKFTSASGYFIEISKSQLWKIPDFFVLKQTLVNASRFYTTELKEFEQKLFEAEWVLAQKEYDLFLEVRWEILSKFSEIKSLSKKSAYIDFCSSLWEVAYKNNYTKPEISKKYDLKILWWRHPVIETIESEFISNDLDFSNSKFVNIITGPNMWWKSTNLRQNALIL